jgi:hypothetical protein
MTQTTATAHTNLVRSAIADRDRLNAERKAAAKESTRRAHRQRFEQLQAKLAEAQAIVERDEMEMAQEALVESIANLKDQEVPSGTAGEFRDLAASAFLPEGTMMSFDGLFDELFIFERETKRNVFYRLILTTLDEVKAAVEANDYSR